MAEQTGKKKQNKAAQNKAGEETYAVTLPGGNKIHVKRGTKLRDALELSNTPPSSTSIAASWNNKVTSLERGVETDGVVEAIDLHSRDGGLIFRRSLTFVLIRAVSELFPDLKVYINHSLNGGYYGEVYDAHLNPGEPVLLVESDFARIKERMNQIIAADEPFERLDVSREEALKIFSEREMDDKVSLLEYRTDEKVSLYKFGNLVNHFYGQLATSSGMLTPFQLHPCWPGFVLGFPPHGKPGSIPEYHHNAKLFEVYQEYERWSRILGLRTVAQLTYPPPDGGGTPRARRALPSLRG